MVRRQGEQVSFVAQPVQPFDLLSVLAQEYKRSLAAGVIAVGTLEVLALDLGTIARP